MLSRAQTLPACSDALARFKASSFKRNTLRGRVDLAPEMPTYEPEPYRFLGLHWAVWPIMALISGAGWLAGLPL